MASGKRVVQVDPQAKTVRLDNGWEVAYDKLLIATGGKPRSLEAFEKAPEALRKKVTLFRNVRTIFHTNNSL